VRLGLVADIHECVERLELALARFRDLQVDQVVVLGDVCESGQRLAHTCSLLARHQAIGVWGNHDFGLCGSVSDAVRRRYDPEVLSYMSSLKPRLEIEDCSFTHVEPWLNPEELADLWFFGGMPDTPERLAQIFGGGSQRLMFAGHYHRWLAVTPDGILPWQGERPLDLARGRHYIVIGALCDGHCALLDTATWQLVPLSTS
jgi:hypothetical protein